MIYLKKKIDEVINDLKEETILIENEMQNQIKSLGPSLRLSSNSIGIPLPVSINQQTQNDMPSTIQQTIEFNATPTQLFEALTDQDKLCVFSESDCIMELTTGSDFMLLSGEILGTNLEIVPDKLIKQKWRFKDWPDDHFSILTLTLEENNGGTKLNLTQIDVPTNQLSKTLSLWEDRFWKKIKTIFGWEYKITSKSY